MASILVEEIAVKSATLPLAKQRVVLDFVNSLISPETSTETDMQANEPPKPPFKSMRGILNRQLKTLEEDLAEVRREMWQNFPRDFPDTESQ